MARIVCWCPPYRRAMDVPGGRSHPESGQATLEYIGLVLVVVALLVGAALVVRHRVVSTPESRFPAVVPAPDAVGGPLDQLALRPRPRPGWIGRGFGVMRRGGRIIVVGGVAFGRGFGRAVLRDLEIAVRDPASILRDGGSLVAAAKDPMGTARAIARDLRAYIRELRAMDPDAAYVRIMEDLGGVSEDLIVARGRALILRRLAAAARDRARRGGVTQP